MGDVRNVPPEPALRLLLVCGLVGMAMLAGHLMGAEFDALEQFEAERRASLEKVERWTHIGGIATSATIAVLGTFALFVLGMRIFYAIAHYRYHTLAKSHYKGFIGRLYSRLVIRAPENIAGRLPSASLEEYADQIDRTFPFAGMFSKTYILNPWDIRTDARENISRMLKELIRYLERHPRDLRAMARDPAWRARLTRLRRFKAFREHADILLSDVERGPGHQGM